MRCLRAALVLAAAAPAACDRNASPSAGAGDGSPRRVLFVTWDTTRADHVGAYGGAARTPRFDELAKRGVLYEHAEACAPITLPSHASMLTGVLPREHGARDNAIFQLAGAARLLPEALKEQGFKTGAFVAAYVLDPKFGLAQGFDVYDAPDASAASQSWSVVERPAGAVADAAIRWIDALRPDDRFFLWVHFYDPHEPLAPADEHARAGVSPYDLEIERCDRELGRLLDHLRGRGLDRGLITAVTADHGESLGEHGERTHGVFLYEST
ncbi:MAG TPA: sulfatase, partial [Myxococcota bacterium]|nr:sulfatase [Myxococcota bacterium]